MDCMQLIMKKLINKNTIVFQYRKRYGLHAILSPGSLGNSEPRSRFSDTDPLFAFFPKVRGTFLSRKVLRKGLEASHSKGTFVHERNLILMAFSLNFRASLEQSIPRRMGTCQQVSENLYVSRCSRWEISTLDASAFAACLFFLFKRSIWTNVQSHCSSARSP